MAYFSDLSIYTYISSPPKATNILWLGLDQNLPNTASFHPAGTKNVGWLSLGHDFPMMQPTEEILDLIWKHCKISVQQTRGIHRCEFCSGPVGNTERHGERLVLGSAEIRVFSNHGYTYAAPNLIYHYISVHQYKPPDEFLLALARGPRPPSPEYFERLGRTGLDWNTNSAAVQKPAP